MRTVLGRLMLLSVSIYIGLGIVLFSAQRNLLYHPTVNNPALIESLGSYAKALQIENGDVSLQVWQLNPGHEHAVMYFGGNAEAVIANGAGFARAFPDATIYLTEYRGFGGSSGQPSESALLADATKIFDYLINQHTRISVIGRSLGTGVATYLASVRDIDRLALVTPYDSIEAVAAGRYPIYPIGLMLKDKFPALNYVPEINSPTLILIAEQDRVVPHTHTEALVEAFGDKDVTTVLVPGTTHDSISEATQYTTILGAFL